MTMKRIFTLAFAAVFAVLLTGCVKTGNTAEKLLGRWELCRDVTINGEESTETVYPWDAGYVLVSVYFDFGADGTLIMDARTQRKADCPDNVATEDGSRQVENLYEVAGDTLAVIKPEECRAEIEESLARLDLSDEERAARVDCEMRMEGTIERLTDDELVVLFPTLNAGVTERMYFSRAAEE